ncbi:uncharacterized protein LOC124832382 [Vigna umbellata]|uniref:uncharacterized protein LOC124832382 n=1 Tax=Vigna umbellata TaxID=87088 RepID=UPI001F5F48FD|nr:uncharacterized protein LOC124832382 [Vigna umbellata]
MAHSILLTLTVFLLSHVNIFSCSSFPFQFHFSVKAKDVVVAEDGYTITTLFDGHKPNIFPYIVLQRPFSSDLILLDSVNSTFYTAQFPISQEIVFTRLSGDGSVGYLDGDVGSARFDKPRSFAFDLRGNVYVADKNNRAIRKISAKGVTTIAGGEFSEKSTSKDVPALNASFSNDFDLTFIPGMCALLVSDHMHRLVRQISLKEEDCTFGSRSGLGAVMTWTLGLGLSCLLGIVIGFAVRPYIISNKGPNSCHCKETWKHCLTSLGKLVPMLFYGAKSAIASCSCSSVYTILVRFWRLNLSYFVCLSRIRINIVAPRPHLESVSLLDLDACNSGEVTKPGKYYDDQLKDLICFDEDSTKASSIKGNDSIGRRNMCHEGDLLVKANMGFLEPLKDNILHPDSSVCNTGIVKRR